MVGWYLFYVIKYISSDIPLYLHCHRLSLDKPILDQQGSFKN